MSSDGHGQGAKRVVLRNTLILMVAQLLCMPLSFVIKAMMASHLGPAEFGVLYLASTIVGFGFLAVEWGQANTLPGLVARDRTQAGAVLGSALAWRIATIPLAYVFLSLLSSALGHGQAIQVALAILVVDRLIAGMTGACQAIDRGFERTQLSAYGAVAAQIGSALFVIPTLLMGGGLPAVLLADMVPSALLFLLTWRSLKRRIGAISVRWDTVKKLLVDGYGFLFVALAMVLQPNVDAIFLAKLAPGDPVGWYAAAGKIVGVLIFPASALVMALYPTLCRLHGEDRERFRQTTSDVLRLITILVVPVAVSCAMYPDVAIRLFSREAYAPAVDNLRVLSLFVLLVYFTMTLGISLMAAGRQRAWAWTQGLCVLVSLIFDPLLVPWFQARTGNGGLGVCVTSVFSEVVMLVVGIWLSPAGVFDRSLRRQLLLVLMAGAAMAAVASLLSSALSPFVAGPLALLAYAGCLVATGGIDKRQAKSLWAPVRRRRTGERSAPAASNDLAS